MQESTAQTVAAVTSSTEARRKQRRGFAMMDPETLRAVCSQGGKTAHAHGKAHRFNPEEASKAGKKGGGIDRHRPDPHGHHRPARRQSQERLRRAARRQAELETALNV